MIMEESFLGILSEAMELEYEGYGRSGAHLLLGILGCGIQVRF